MGMARQFSAMFLGRQIDAIYHTGVFVYGRQEISFFLSFFLGDLFNRLIDREYFFGGGIQMARHEYIVERYGMGPIEVLFFLLFLFFSFLKLPFLS